MSVYLIHFDRPFKHARHYVGWAKDLPARVAHHRAGSGANLLRHVNTAGIGWTVVRVWPDGDRTFERRLKNTKNTPMLCPVCRDAPRSPDGVPSVTGVDVDTLLGIEVRT